MASSRQAIRAAVLELMAELLGGLDGLGGGAVAEWLADRLEGIVGALGFEPADLRLKKPVLTNSSNVLFLFSSVQLAHRYFPFGSILNPSIST